MVPGVQNIMFKVHRVFHSKPRHMSDLTSTIWTSKLSDCQRTPSHSCSHITMSSKQHSEPLNLPHFPQYLRWKRHKLISVNDCWRLQSTADCTVSLPLVWAQVHKVNGYRKLQTEVVNSFQWYGNPDDTIWNIFVFINDVQKGGFQDIDKADIHNILATHIAKSTEDDLIK